MASFKNVIFGGGMVAGYAAKVIAEAGTRAGEWAIVSSDDVLPYERPPLSKGFLAGKDTAESVLINNAAFYRDHKIEVLLKTIVDKLDTRGKRLHLAGGRTIDYERLLIATGARVHTFNIPGANASNLFYLRSFDDSKRIREAAGNARQAVVIGGGFIAMEVSAVLAQKGVRTTMVFPDERIWQRFFDAPMSQMFQCYYEERGVTVMPRSEVVGFKGGARVESVVLKSGQSLPADIVVAGIGVTPETSVLSNSGVELDNGVIVNEYLETNIPGVYAAGDVTNYVDVLWNKRRHVEHWDNAVEQGQHVARVMLGQRKPFEHVPYFFSDIFDLSYELWGDTGSPDRVVYRGDVKTPSFSAWWIKDGCVAAAFVMRRPDEERESAQSLIRSRTPVNADVLGDESRPLSTAAKRAS